MERLFLFGLHTRVRFVLQSSRTEKAHKVLGRSKLFFSVLITILIIGKYSIRLGNTVGNNVTSLPYDIIWQDRNRK
jgi:hypothetical protein